MVLTAYLAGNELINSSDELISKHLKQTHRTSWEPESTDSDLNIYVQKTKLCFKTPCWSPKAVSVCINYYSEENVLNLIFKLPRHKFLLTLPLKCSFHFSCQKFPIVSFIRVSQGSGSWREH